MVPLDLIQLTEIQHTGQMDHIQLMAIPLMGQMVQVLHDMATPRTTAMEPLQRNTEILSTTLMVHL